jgi:transposase
MTKSAEGLSREALVDIVRELRGECAKYRILARESGEHLAQMQQRIIAAETKLEAIHAGLVDIDAWVFLDLSGIKINAAGKLEGTADAIEKLKQQKPHFFKEVI